MYALRILLIGITVFQLACLSLESASAKDGVNNNLLDTEVEGITQLVKEVQAAQIKSQKELEAAKKEFQFEIAELKNKNNYLEQIINSTGLRPYDVGRPPADCVIGNNFRYHEFPDSYGSGVPYTLPAAGNRYQCLDLCRQDPSCLAVSFQKTSPHVCSAYSVDPAVISPSNDWDYYRLEYTNSCWLDQPVIEFMASLPGNGCYNDGEILPLSLVVYDSGDGMKSDYKYHCPVAGTYRFTIIALAYNPSGFTRLKLMKNDVLSLALLNFQKTDDDDDPGSVEVYAFCEPGDTISVVSWYTDSCVGGGPYAMYTTLSGRLVQLQ